ncbi:MAG TPA: 2-dehydro-3-deoxyphosphogluconate aldolase [Acidaminococcaceae bacterium]|jgi:2-dehydro-3-deoxyphosphogluconate aldolase/(4S)-4-hydroxy-2-oxoglutarate aldolase|nr:2-dehydro-3-deoxyphosphogluconate aldolase [Acidaminococcaceae bacterium]
MIQQEVHALMPELEERKIVSIVRGVCSKDMKEAAEAVYRGGIRFLEVTFDMASEENSRDMLRSITRLREHFGGRMHIGAGTVLTPEQVVLAAKAGAEFIISPDMDVAVIQKTKELGLLSMPGALTPSEVKTAWMAGADIVKIFPASLLGPAYVKALKAPLSQVKLAAVGGVGVENIRTYLDAGYDGFGIGGNLINRERVERHAWDELTCIAQAYADAIH